ncbi:MAG: hypothetical protein HF314_04670 [Ignavibacteria bacterium]|jgi:hypothetical protein|nr:hypothetical protein [Ignavibacteria bacterium]MCU7502343.1 hypothetical protein [Ignavibacteria bacterium]MCU7515092.1 hypothetical protein [Ignavibacteria bacterium]
MNGRTNKTFILAAALVVLLSSRAFSQFSFYGNTSFGYNENPLYNYQKKPDQLKQSYLEMNYLKQFESSKLSFSYVSGLMLFNQLSDRNFYEHNIFARYNLRLSKKSLSKPEEASSPESSSDSTAEINGQEENASEEDASAESIMEDSSASYLGFTLQAGARHDKTAFKEFDNFGSGFSLSYKTQPWDAFSLRISNSAGLRNYSYISELSNLTDQLSIQIFNRYNGSYQYGISFSGGIKYYTRSMYDTTKFESKRSFNQKSQGKGKLGSKISVPSSKQILLEPQENGTSQFTAGVFFNKNWETSTSLKTNFLYRFNPRTLTRYLAQYANTSMLSEDIYNDFFSYQGFEAKVSLYQPLPWSLQMSVEYNFQQKNFEAPALNLEGVQIGSEKRSDLANSVELYLSRGFSLFEGFDLDLMLGAGILRNQSNDDYNDFSSYHLTGTIGIGF